VSTLGAVGFIEEPSRRVPLAGRHDVLVLGGGPAGMAAAVSAARQGARTLLVERYGFLGGMGTAGGVTNFAGLYGRRRGQMEQLVRGVADDLLARIAAIGGLNAPQAGLSGRIQVRSYDVPAYQCAADGWMASAGVALLFHAQAAAVVMHSPERIAALIVESKSGRLALQAQEFIDASGDGDLAAWAAVPFELGDGQGSALFPSTMCRIGQVDAERALAAVGEFKAIDRWMAAAAASGRYRFARTGAILRPQRNPSQWRANVTQLANADGRAVDGTDVHQLSAAEVEGRRQVLEYLRFLRAEVPGFEAAELDSLPAQVGIRETRRVLGAYVLTGEDVLSGARFADSIGLNTWPMEQHVAGRIEWGFFRDNDNAFNQLPYRMLVPPGVVNLHVAGRCASMTHEGQSAARASGACFVMGQAAGTAAALRLAGRLNVPALQQALREGGAELGD
jgi:hypothetical protein